MRISCAVMAASTAGLLPRPRPLVKKTRPPTLTAWVARRIPPVLIADAQTLPVVSFMSLDGEADRTHRPELSATISVPPDCAFVSANA